MHLHNLESVGRAEYHAGGQHLLILYFNKILTNYEMINFVLWGMMLCCHVMIHSLVHVCIVYDKTSLWAALLHRLIVDSLLSSFFSKAVLLLVVANADHWGVVHSGACMHEICVSQSIRFLHICFTHTTNCETCWELKWGNSSEYPDISVLAP